MQRIKTIEGDSVTTLLYRYLGRDDDPVEEALYQLNPHLPRFGPLLPAGITVTLPPLPAKKAQKVVQIWD